MAQSQLVDSIGLMVIELDLDKDSQKLWPAWEMNPITFRIYRSCPKITTETEGQPGAGGGCWRSPALANDHQMMKGYKVGRVAMEIDRIVN